MGKPSTTVGSASTVTTTPSRDHAPVVRRKTQTASPTQYFPSTFDEDSCMGVGISEVILPATACTRSLSTPTAASLEVRLAGCNSPTTSDTDSPGAASEDSRVSNTWALPDACSSSTTSGSSVPSSQAIACDTEAASPAKSSARISSKPTAAGGTQLAQPQPPQLTFTAPAGMDKPSSTTLGSRSTSSTLPARDQLPMFRRKTQTASPTQSLPSALDSTLHAFEGLVESTSPALPSARSLGAATATSPGDRLSMCNSCTMPVPSSLDGAAMDAVVSGVQELSSTCSACAAASCGASNLRAVSSIWQASGAVSSLFAAMLHSSFPVSWSSPSKLNVLKCL
mmetsp:Transcript_111442/g.279071  ORF Transcript_111442/g.279071 Transcript_111442/m.279071 type:complete len:339 (-) Transcript_111442:100-1116(-)